MKSRHLAACLTAAGRINGLAVDHGRSLDAAIQNARGGLALAGDAVQFKHCVASVLGQHASLTLVDPGSGQVVAQGPDCPPCLIFGYEQDVYNKDVSTLVPAMPPDWNVRRLALTGARAIKLYLPFDPESAPMLQRQRKVVVERVGAECAAIGLPFFLEPVTSTNDPAQRPHDVLRAVQEFSQSHYQVDVLKIELPVQPQLVGQCYSHAQAVDALRRVSDASPLPLVYLSGGVPFDALLAGLELAGVSGARFNGVLCGRSLWNGGIPVFAQQGAAGLQDWLQHQALPNLQRLGRLVDTHGTPLLQESIHA